MPGGGHATIAGIRRHSPGTVVMVCSSYDDRHTRTAMRDAGAAAYVVKGADDLLDAAYEVLGHLRVAVGQPRQAAHERRAPTPLRFHDDRPADGRGPLAHAPQPEVPRTVGDRSRVEADTVVDDPHHELVVVPTHGHAHDAGVRVLAGVADRLLRDAVGGCARRQRRLFGERARDGRGDVDTLERALDERLERSRQPVVLERRRVELEHQIAQSRRRVPPGSFELADAVLEVGIVDAPPEELQVHHVRRHDLDGVVVDVARDALALLLTRFDDGRHQLTAFELACAELVGHGVERATELADLVARVTCERAERSPAPMRARHRDEVANCGGSPTGRRRPARPRARAGSR